MLQAYPGADVVAGVIWLPMLAADDDVAAREAMRLVADSRARHFYDPDRVVGRAVARSLGASGEIAWDIYLFYGPEARWDGDVPPRPLDWRHQLRGRAWADPERWRWGDQLAADLLELGGRFPAQ